MVLIRSGLNICWHWLETYLCQIKTILATSLFSHTYTDASVLYVSLEPRPNAKLSNSKSFYITVHISGLLEQLTLTVCRMHYLYLQQAVII